MAEFFDATKKRKALAMPRRKKVKTYEQLVRKQDRLKKEIEKIEAELVKAGVNFDDAKREPGRKWDPAEYN